MANLDDLLRDVHRAGASNLHLVSNAVPLMRLNGNLVDVPGWERLARRPLNPMLRTVCGDKRWSTFMSRRDLDLTYSPARMGRYQVNMFWSAQGPGAIFRRVPDQIRPLKELGLPAAVEKLTNLRSGLLLFSGPSGAGKSTTLAALVDRINHTDSRHIVTIENPVEFVHRPALSVISHRQVGQHVESYVAGLRAALRQDADIIVVGELREPAAIRLALSAAEMGVLVMATMHTRGCARTIERLIESFPTDEQPQARSMLAVTLQAVVSQLLLRDANGRGQHVAVEFLQRTSNLANTIRMGKIMALRGIIKNGRNQGMQTMDDALFALVKSGAVLAQDAYRKAEDKQRFARAHGAIS